MPNALDGNPIGSLYPQPQQAQQGGILGQNPLYAMGMLSQINANQRFQQEFNAQKAVGAAFQNALNPDGSVDQGRLAAGLQDPAAAYAAPAAIGDMLSQRGQQIQNSTNQFQLAASQNSLVQNAIGAMAADPNLSPDKVRSTITGLATRTAIPSSILTGVLGSMPQSGGPAALRNWANGFGNISIGSSGTAARVSGPPTAAGAPTTISQGEANYAGAVPTALPPGQSNAIATNQQAFVSDQAKSAETLANVRQLQSALPLIQQLGNSSFGPGSPQWAQLKGALSFAGVIDPNASDLQVRQEAGKYLLKYARGAQDAGRSDHALSAAIGSNPNLDLTQPANMSLITNQIGMDRMDAAIPLAFSQTHPSLGDRAQYLNYKNQFYQNNDQRAFSFDQMTPQARRQVIDSLGSPNSPAYQKFARSYQLAKQTGIITPEQAPNGQQ